MKTLSSNAVAKSMSPRKVPAMRPLALFLALAISASAQQPGPQPPPQPPGAGPGPGPGQGQNMQPPGPPQQHRSDRDHDRDHDRDGDRRGGPPGMMGGSMGGRPPRYDGFEKLSEDEKTKVRAAFEKAWQRPEVIEARDRAMRANEEMRNKLHAALKEIDPQVVGILEKAKPPFPMDQRGLPEMPKPESPEFARMAVARIGAEMLSVARPDRKDDTRRFHDRVMQMPRIRDELAKLEQLPPGEKMEGFKRFRDVYRQVAGEEFNKLREKYDGFRGEGPSGGFRRPPEGSPPSGPGPGPGSGLGPKPEQKPN